MTPSFEIVKEVPPKPAGNHKASHLYQAIKALSFMRKGKTLRVECGEVKPLIAQQKAHLWSKVNFEMRVSTAIRGKDIYITKMA